MLSDTCVDDLRRVADDLRDTVAIQVGDHCLVGAFALIQKLAVHGLAPVAERHISRAGRRSCRVLPSPPRSFLPRTHSLPGSGHLARPGGNGRRSDCSRSGARPRDVARPFQRGSRTRRNGHPDTRLRDHDIQAAIAIDIIGRRGTCPGNRGRIRAAARLSGKRPRSPEGEPVRAGNQIHLALAFDIARGRALDRKSRLDKLFFPGLGRIAPGL